MFRNSHEEQQLRALRSYDILDTPPDSSFDRITELVAQLLNVPIAIVSLVDSDRIWFKSHHGIEVGEVDRAPGLCASAIFKGENGSDLTNHLKELYGPGPCLPERLRP